MSGASQTNKANGQWTFYRDLNEIGIKPGAETIEAIARALPDRSEINYFVNTTNNIYPGSYGTCTIKRLFDSRITVTFYELNSGRVWVGKIYLLNTPAWDGWVEQATIKPLQEHNLPISLTLAKNSGSHYWINQENIVTISIMFQAAQNFSDWQTFAVLPEGYRPSVTKDYPAVYFSPHAAGIVRIETDGTMKVGTQVTNQSYLYFNTTFIVNL